MGAKASTDTGVMTYSNVGEGNSSAGQSDHTVNAVPGSSHNGNRSRARTRSLGGAAGHRGHHQLLFTTSGGGSPDSEGSTPEDRPRSRSLALGSSLPLHLFPFQGIKCPVCSKFVQSDDIERHLVACLTKPRVIYNDDVLREDKGECVICFEDLLKGETIARLPCLCIYHKTCIDRWFAINRSCPEHPSN